jgi:hypothetical protein
MGDKKAALLQVTGGNIKTTISYDNAGNQIEEKTNELGEAVSYFDRKEKRSLTKKNTQNVLVVSLHGKTPLEEN